MRFVYDKHMARSNWKQAISISLDRDVMQTLKKVAKHWGVSRSSVVQQAIVFLAAQPGNLPEIGNGKRESA